MDALLKYTELFKKCFTLISKCIVVKLCLMHVHVQSGRITFELQL